MARPRGSPAALGLSIIALSSVAAAAEPAAPGDLTLDEREPALLYLTRPKGRGPGLADLASIQDAASRAFAERTNLALRPLESFGFDPAELDACDPDRRMTCWLGRLRAERGSARPEPPGARASRSRPRYLFVLAVHPGGKAGDEHYGLLLDLDLAQETYERAHVTEPGWEEGVEEQIFRAVLQGELTRVAAGDDAARRRYFQQLVEETFRPAFERTGHWEPYGRIELSADRAGLPIELDGDPIGTTALGARTIHGVTPGERTLVITGPGGARISLPAHVDRGRVTALSAAVASSGPKLARATVLWGGVAVAAAGAVVGGLAIARAGSDVRSACLVRPGSDADRCSELGLPTFGFDPGAAPSADPAAVNPSGVPIAALGVGLLAGGATWALGTALFGADDDYPWLQLGAGLALGALTFAATVALDPR